MRITPFFRWYDLWVGVYVDVAAGAVYICPLPMLGLKLSWAKAGAARVLKEER